MPPLMFYSTTRKETIEQHTKLGLEYHDSGRYDLAAIQFRQAIELNRQGAVMYRHNDWAMEALQKYIIAPASLKNQKLITLEYYIQPLQSC